MIAFNEMLAKIELLSIRDKHKMIYMWIKQGNLSLRDYTKIMAVIPY